MKILLPLFLSLFTLSAFAQQPDRWHGLIIDQSSPETAIAALGKPKTDKEPQLFRPIKYNEWFDLEMRKRTREMHFENLEGFKDVKLYFLEDKLIGILLEPEKLAASTISQTYGVPLTVLVGDTDKAMNPRGGYPTVYNLMYKGENAYLFVLVGNSSFGSILGKSAGIEQRDPNSYPGKALMIEMISRTIEDRKSVNLLK